MNEATIFILLAVALMSLFGLAAAFAWPYLRGGVLVNQARSIKRAQGKKEPISSKEDAYSRIDRVGVEGTQIKMSNSEITLTKKLMYAQWSMTPRTYYVYAAVISFILFVLASLKLNMIWWAIALFAGPAIMSALVARASNKRFNKFDRDYAPFLLSLVGLLKTGMNPLQALGTAATSLEHDSLVRLEVEVMLERLRVGAPEDKSVGAFGNDINHPEIELFVQALLLSMRVGGTLSDTLERLARQVRRRQFFRSQAVAAIGLQRGSIWFILVIQVSLMVFIYFMLPRFILESINDPMGWQVWQFGIFVMAGGMFWVRQVSKIRC